MGYRLNPLDEPVFMAGAKPMRAEFGIHHRLESCVVFLQHLIVTTVENPYLLELFCFPCLDISRIAIPHKQWTLSSILAPIFFYLSSLVF